MKVITLDEESNTKIVCFLLKNIEDPKSLSKKIISGEIDCCAIKPQLVLSIFQLVVAANKAVQEKQKDKLKTKFLRTELLFNLSVSKNIHQSLSTFGFNEKEKHAVIVVFEENGEQKLETVKSQLSGEICGIEELESLSDINLIKKTYNITEKELEVSSLIDSIVSRIATKDFASLK